MTDTASLLEMYELACGRCGGSDPDMFTDVADLEAFLARPPAGIRILAAGDFTGFGPVHRKCVTPARRRPQRGYDLLRSVAG